MKIVCDTNVLISALLFQGGIPDKILRGILSGRFGNYISPDIISELLRILNNKFKLSVRELIEIQDLLINSSKMIYPLERIRVVRVDDADNRIFECALTAKVNYLITGDKHHLLPLKKIKNIKIVSPKDFARIIGIL